MALGSIEYAVDHPRHTACIVVLGHSKCGAVTAHRARVVLFMAISKVIVQAIKPAIDMARVLTRQISRQQH